MTTAKEKEMEMKDTGKKEHEQRMMQRRMGGYPGNYEGLDTVSRAPRKGLKKAGNPDGKLTPMGGQED